MGWYCFPHVWLMSLFLGARKWSCFTKFQSRNTWQPKQSHCGDRQWHSLSLVDNAKCLASYAMLCHVMPCYAMLCHWAHPHYFQWETLPRNEIESVEWSNDGKKVWEALRWRPGKPEERTPLATSPRANLLRPCSHHHHQQNHNHNHNNDNNDPHQ